MIEHPIRLEEVKAAIERWTAEQLAGNEGTGKVVIEFDFQDWKAVSYRPVFEGRKIRLTGSGRGVT